MKACVNLALCGFTLAAATLLSSEVAAQTNAIADGNWSDGSTWDNGEPNITSSAFIDGGFTVTIDQLGETTNLVDLGTASGETGNLDITGGDLTVSNVNPANFPSSIRVGQAGGSTGNLTMTGGTVSIVGNSPSPFAIADLLVGDVGTGTMTLSGGIFNVADEVFVGLGGASNGTLNVNGGTLNVAGRNLLIAFFGGAEGNFNLSDGAVNVGGFMFSSFDPGATSTMTQTGGTLSVAGALIHGRQGNATFDHSGGAVTVLAAAPHNNGDFVVGDNGPNNVYNISGSATLDVGRNFLMGVFGAAHAVVNQSGGTVDIANRLRMGIDGVGEWNQTGGMVNIGDSAWLGDFDTSHGTYKISGGTLNITNDLSVGGALASNAPEMPTGTQGQALDADGTFIVSGSGGTINIDGDLLANPGDHTRRRPDGTGDNVSMLIFEILDNTGVSLMNVAGMADLTGSIVDVDLLGGSFGLGSTFDLITASDISEDFLQATEDLNTIQLAVVPGGNGEILRATLIPEPASLLLVGLSAIGLLGTGAFRRRRVRT